MTATGSFYEIDTDSKKIRRLNGKSDPTPRVGKDGEWREYSALYPDPLERGACMVIIWKGDVALQPQTKEKLRAGMFAVPTTRTSPVESIED